VSSGGVFMLMVMLVGLLGLVEQSEHTPCDLSLEGAKRFGAGATSGEASLPERLCLWADSQLGGRDPVQRHSAAVAPTIQPMALQLA
jgi:hypothetical protein